MLTLLVTAALAADRVLDLDGDTDPAAVAQVLGAETAPQPITATDLAQRPARVLGGGQLTWCTGAPAGLDDLAQAMEEAEGAMAYMEFEKAATTLGSALGQLQCLADPVDPEVAARLFYLRGIVAHRSGFADQAAKAFGIALVFQPELTWDDAFPPKALSVFQQARDQAASQETVAIDLVPAGELTVDGRATSTLALVPGNHLLQLDGQTATLEVYPGTSPTLVLPALFTGIDDISDPTAQTTLAQLAGDDTLYVVQQGRVWGPTEGAGWTELGRLPKTRAADKPDKAEPPPEPEPDQASAGGPGWLLPGGGVVALGGAAAGTVGLVLTRNAAVKARAQTTQAAYEDWLATAESRVWIARVGYGVAAVGAVAAVAGVVLAEDRGWSVVPTPGGLVLTVVR